jgi:Ca2+-binding RTX toxin-like protein
LIGTAGADTLSGKGENDTITGGAGNDQLFGGDGDDTYFYNAGDGNDTISEDWFAGNDRLVLGSGLTPANTTITRNGADITLNFADGGSVALLGEDRPYNQGVEQIVFGDGTTWSPQDLEGAYVAQQEASGATTLTGFDQRNDVLIGTAGSDTLSGKGGNDTITGGAGNDQLFGGDGDDTYFYNAGNGNDTISEDWFAGNDRLVLGSGLNPDNTIVTQAGSDLTLHFTDGGSVQLIGETLSYNQGVEQIVFGNGVAWTSTDLQNAAAHG